MMFSSSTKVATLQDQFCFPVHDPFREHWFLVHVSLPDASITVYDSLWAEPCRRLIKRLRRFFSQLRSEVTTMQQADGGTVDDSVQTRKAKKIKWKIRSSRSICPQQKNAFDCGVFVCVLLYRISRGLPVTMEDGFGMDTEKTEKSMQWRHWIAERLLTTLDLGK